MNGPADWMRLAIRQWLVGNGELTALGLTAVDRANARRWIRNKHIRAAFNLIPGERFSDRLTALVAAVERLNRVRQGYRHQRQDGAIFSELEAAARWAELPAERQLRTILFENSDPFELQQEPGKIIMKLIHEDFENDFVPAGTDQNESSRRLCPQPGPTGGI